MNQLDCIIALYADFETRVQKSISNFFGSNCSACSGVCCKIDYCRETQESLFLSRLREEYQPAASYSDEAGWLSETGCVLTTGRPPVCYEYLCGEILSAQPTFTHRYAVNVFSQLISHVGKRAYRGQHIVEICEAEELQRIKLSAFERRLGESKAAFHVIEIFYENTFLSARDWGKLTKIVSAPKEVNLRG
jgi:hypothetical protein